MNNTGYPLDLLADQSHRRLALERIAQADSYLNDVDLPGYLEVAGALSRMVLDFADLRPCDAVSEAREVLRRLVRGSLLS